MTDLITLTEYKSLKGIALTNTGDDTKLNSLISSCSAFVENYCSRIFIDYYSTDFVELQDVLYSDINVLTLKNYPVVSITEVAERDLSNSTDYVPMTTYVSDASMESIYKMDAGTAQDWTIGPASVRITYKFGFPTVPIDLKMAIVDLVSYYANKEYTPNQSMMGASLQNGQDFTAYTIHLPPHIKRVLDLYRDVS